MLDVEWLILCDSQQNKEALCYVNVNSISTSVWNSNRLVLTFPLASVIVGQQIFEYTEEKIGMLQPPTLFPLETCALFFRILLKVLGEIFFNQPQEGLILLVLLLNFLLFNCLVQGILKQRDENTQKNGSTLPDLFCFHLKFLRCFSQWGNPPK